MWEAQANRAFTQVDNRLLGHEENANLCQLANWSILGERLIWGWTHSNRSGHPKKDSPDHRVRRCWRISNEGRGALHVKPRRGKASYSLSFPLTEPPKARMPVGMQKKPSPTAGTTSTIPTQKQGQAAKSSRNIGDIAGRMTVEIQSNPIYNSCQCALCIYSK